MSWQPPPMPREPQPKAQTLYDILQVSPQASATIIRYSYRFLAAMYHPDNADSGDAERFRQISDAWRVLSDSGRRQAYDAQIGFAAAQKGPQAPSQQAGAQAPHAQAPKTSLAWNEVELRLAVLQVLLEARRKRPQTGGASASMLQDCLSCTMQDIEFTLWYLREKGFIARGERDFMITVTGVDYLVDQLSKTQPLDAGGRSAPININLPATL